MGDQLLDEQLDLREFRKIMKWKYKSMFFFSFSSGKTENAYLFILASVSSFRRLRYGNRMVKQVIGSIVVSILK